ncbi:procathepsin L-like [Patiria miniata]|uniref:Uncharacterized protein n=1 Tax=Patiria miniata TaxID=46514 RepID=A0A914BK15_PATMI|nr:procathepsin L-like [Patiria miniata]
MKTTSLLCFLAGLFVSCDVASPAHIDIHSEIEWKTWKEKYGKKYDSMSEEVEKRSIWERNYVFINEHYSKLDRTFDLSMNEYGDQTQMTRKQSTFTYRQLSPVVQSHHVVLPTSVDWRTKGDVTPVRNQGQSGSAAAFAAADAVASYHAINTGKLATLSAQEVQDCCQSHIADFIFDCIHKLGGLCKDNEYKPGNGTCRSRYCTPYAEVPTGGKEVNSGSEDALAEAVDIEPVMVSIDASQASFQFYSSGVYASGNCSSTLLDHSMLLVGYGQQNGQEYWICKNSWGVSWGMNGYVLMARNKKNMCGIATDATYPN